MTDVHPKNQGFYRATLLLRSLLQNGLSHVVISPGSRSTPLTMAAAILPQLSKHVILDERSAAFIALGIGKATNTPAALICTSGTAVANYYPAVIEARKSGVPMLLLTADRPGHLQKTGANQTIDQKKIFGTFPVLFKHINETTDADETTIKQIAQQVFSYAKKERGPVHLNYPFAKPLEPTEEFLQTVAKENQKLDFSSAKTGQQKDEQAIQVEEGITTTIKSSCKPLIIVGQTAPNTNLEAISEWAALLNAPILSERGNVDSKLTIAGFEGFLRAPATQSKLEPDMILRFGRQPASKSLLNAIQKWQPKAHIHFSDTGEISDIANTTTHFIKWSGMPFPENLSSKASDQWHNQWKKTETVYRDELQNCLANTHNLTDGHIYHHITPKIPDDWSVFISNSFPARDQSMFARWGTQALFTNRGVSGIDGITSTAAGINIGSNKPVILFTGDLAFLHDTNALLNQKELQQPLVIIVINNKGGSIFRMLPIVEHQEHFETYFETPQAANIKQLATAYNLNYELIDTPLKLQNLSLQKYKSPGISIVECKTNPDASMRIRKEMWDFSV